MVLFYKRNVETGNIVKTKKNKPGKKEKRFIDISIQLMAYALSLPNKQSYYITDIV